MPVSCAGTRLCVRMSALIDFQGVCQWRDCVDMSDGEYATSLRGVESYSTWNPVDDRAQRTSTGSCGATSSPPSLSPVASCAIG